MLKMKKSKSRSAHAPNSVSENGVVVLDQPTAKVVKRICDYFGCTPLKAVFYAARCLEIVLIDGETDEGEDVAHRDTLTVPEFAVEVRKGADWVYDQIRLHRLSAGRKGVRPLPLGKPYQIARSEVLRLKSGGAL